MDFPVKCSETLQEVGKYPVVLEYKPVMPFHVDFIYKIAMFNNNTVCSIKYYSLLIL